MDRQSSWLLNRTRLPEVDWLQIRGRWQQIKGICESLTKLETLDLSKNPDLTDGVVEIADCMSQHKPLGVVFDGHRHHRDGHRILVQVQELAHACRGLQQVRRRGTGGNTSLKRAGGILCETFE